MIEKQVMYKCDHCPHETETCVKLVHDDRTECLEPEQYES